MSLQRQKSSLFSRRKRFAFTVTAVLFGTAVGVLISSLLFRTTMKEVDDTPRLRTSDPFLHHTFKPNTSGLLRWGPYLVPYFTNSLGYRDRSCRRIEPTSHSDKRILLLGDSFLEGLGVSYEHTAADQLEQLFRRSGRSVEVLNGAVASYSPFLEYRRLRRFFEAGYKTDMVVLFLDISDVQDEASARYDLLAENQNFSFSYWMPLLNVFRRSGVPQDFWEVVTFSKRERKDQYYKVRDSWTEDDGLFKEYGALGVQNCKENILRIKNLARANRVLLRLVLYPWPTQIRSMRIPSRYETIFGAFARQNRIAVTNLLPAFRALPHWQDYFLRHDVHWNNNGHLLVANRLFLDLGDL